MEPARHFRIAMLPLTIGLLGCSALAGCVSERTVLNDQHCANNDGDATCAERYGEARGFCIDGLCGPTPDQDGCVAELPADLECYRPCGEVDGEAANCPGGESSSSGGSSGGSTTTGDESSSSGDESTSTGPMPCQGNDECTSDAAPFCAPAVGECVSCDQLTDGNGNGACADADAMAPLCIGAECVACDPSPEGDTSVCDAQLLVCGDDNACGPCTAHSQCDSGACNMADGTCFDPANVVHVDGDGGQDYTSVVAAVGAIDAGMSGVVIVHELNGGGSYQGDLTIDQGKTVALLGAEAESPIVQGTGGNPGLRVEGKATRVYIDRLEMSLSGAEGLIVDAATVDVRRSRVVQNSGGGILAQAGAQLYVENCFVGGAEVGVNAIVVDASSAEFVYTSITAGFVGARALSCTNPTSVTLRNSIALTGGPDDPLECPTADVSTSGTEDVVGNFDGSQDWFSDYASGDLSLTKTGSTTFADIATWQDGDPLTDIDGDARPSTNGSMDYAGADVPM